MAIFMKYGTLAGEVTAKGYEGWVELNSLQFGVGRGISTGVAGASTRESTAPSVSEVTVTTAMDSFSPLALNEAIGGKGTDVKIDITRTDSNGTNVAFQKYILEQVMISGYSLSSGGDRPTESMSLNFSKIDSEYLNIDSDFQTTTTGNIIYDLVKATTA